MRILLIIMGVVVGLPILILVLAFLKAFFGEIFRGPSNATGPSQSNGDLDASRKEVMAALAELNRMYHHGSPEERAIAEKAATRFWSKC